jgi:signal transduction histidine kinase
MPVQAQTPSNQGNNGTAARCFLAIPSSVRFAPVLDAVRKAALVAGFDLIQPSFGQPYRETLIEDISHSDCVIADLSTRNSNIPYEVGLARAMGKGILLISQKPELRPADFMGLDFVVVYKPTKGGLSELTRELTVHLEQFRRFPRRNPSIAGSLPATSFLVDWDRLEPSEAENLCRELLVQMGYRRVDWSKRVREFDLVAELQKRDPDGFEYSELWLISMGRNFPVEMIAERVYEDLSYFQRALRREAGKSLGLEGQVDGPVTILFIGIMGESDRINRLLSKRGDFSSPRSRGGGIRLRVWGRGYLTSLVQQFPQLGYKYFSDEGRSQSKYRKTPEELYQENVELGERQANLIAELTEERKQRVRAERDAAWKDISFSAAHKIGNPIFAIETNLDPLRKRVSENRLREGLEVIDRIEVSVEKAKGIVDQFKSLTRAQEIKPLPMLLRPVIEEACRTARENNVICEIECPDQLMIQADPDRLSECFDELVANALHWFDKPDRHMNIRVAQPAPPLLPRELDTRDEFTLIEVTDNGRGVALGEKEKIFDAFFTTQPQGTGLGLALVRRIVEGHGGLVFETGISGEGAKFIILLPSQGESTAMAKISAVPSAKRRHKKEGG